MVEAPLKSVQEAALQTAIPKLMDGIACMYIGHISKEMAKAVMEQTLDKTYEQLEKDGVEKEGANDLY